MNERQREQVLDHVIHNIAFIPVSIELYNALYDSSRKQGNSSLGVVSTVAESLLWQYLEDMQEEYPAEKGRSVHWKDPNSGRLIELKQNTELRTRYFGEWKVAFVKDGSIEWEGRSYKSPSQACNAMRGDTSNNAWIEFEIKRPGDNGFRLADKLRK